MKISQPIYTEKAQCQDCYRCVRNCPVKAIKIEQSIASVVEELCIHCGTCVNSCPAGAKKVRDDRLTVKELIDQGCKVVVSLAPSYKSEFDSVQDSVLIHALRKLGFYGVSETALGAQEVAAHTALLLQKEKSTWISSACPTVVEYIQKYKPQLSSNITPFLSPLLAHCRMLQNAFGKDIKVVFIGPCIAKKQEAAQFPDLLSAALTFEDLWKMFEEAGITLDNSEYCDSEFIPKKANEGVLYPVDGGMVACVKSNCTVHDTNAMHFSGMNEICSILDSIQNLTNQYSLFLELLACPGGCINGPRSQCDKGTLLKRLAILNNPHEGTSNFKTPTIDIDNKVLPIIANPVIFSDDDIVAVLRKMGKHCAKDELNCGGCGYGNCRDFARAILENKAETPMCVTYMRQLAHKKANMLIKAMPSGVVIVDKEFKIIECNDRFINLAGQDSSVVNQTLPGLYGAILEKVFPVSHLFRFVLNSGEDIIDKDIRIGDRILHSSVFTIEPGSIFGGIFNDVTAPELKKEEIIEKARAVIRNNLTTVQNIAYLLGENASETEMVLSRIIESFDHKHSGDSHGK